MKNIKFTAACMAACFLLVLLAAPAAAQVEGCATENSRQMSFLSGAWKVESRFRTSTNPEKWETTSGRSEIRDVFPGCLWQEEFRGIRDEKPLTVIGLFGFSNITGKLQHTWSHSQHGLLTFYEGSMEENRLVFDSRINVRGVELILRKVVEKTDQGFDVRTERSADEGKTWDAGWFLSYTREK